MFIQQEILELEYFGNSLKQYLVFLILIIGSLALGKILYFIIKNVIRKITSKTKTEFDDILVDVLEKPVIFVLIIFAFYAGYNQLNLPSQVGDFFDHISLALLIIAVVWFLIKLIDEIIVHYINPLVEKSETDIDDHLVPLLKKTVNVTLVIIAILIILSNFGLNVTSAVAGLGLGGLAVALAAQETLKNVLAGITILTDKPFKLGEWVQINDLQGTVVEIGLRSTRLKTTTGELITVPNSVIASTPVIDFTRYKSKKIVFQIGLSFDTPAAKIETAKRIIKEHVEKAEKVVKETIDVSFVKLNTSSLDLEIKFDVTTNSGAIITSIKDKLNLEIKKSFEKEKISFAYPQTIQIKKQDI